MSSVRIKRGTRAQIASAAAANGLKQGELYHVIDENRVDVGTGTDASSALATKSEVDGKEPAISAGSTAQYWRGDKSWRDFFTDVRAATLTGLSTVTNAAVAAADTVLVAIGKLQAQVSAKFDKSGGAISGDVSVAGNVLVTSGALGYGGGAGGNATQPTNKGSPVNLHKPSGRITMNSAGLAGNSVIPFIVNNSTVMHTDTVVCNVVGGTGDVNAYTCSTFPFAGGFYVSLRNMTTGTLYDEVQLQFNVIKGATA